VEFVAEGADADVEQAGGLGAVIVAAFEDGEDVLTFQLAQGEWRRVGRGGEGVPGRGGGRGYGRERGRGRLGGARGGEGEVVGFEEGGRLAEDDGAFDDVLEFADVAGPVVVVEGLEAGVAEARDMDAVLAGEALEEVLGEKGDILPAFAEGGDVDGDDVEAEVEVLAELLAGDAQFELAVGGGEDADIDLDGAGAPDPFELAFLEDAQEFGLDDGGDFADLVEEEGPAVGELEAALALGDGAGEGAFFVAEELAFDEVFGDGGAIEGDEGAGVAGAFAVERAGDELLAGAAFALDEDGGVGAGDAAEEGPEFLDGRALAEELTAGVFGVLAEEAVDLDEVGVLGGLLEDEIDLVRGEGFDEVVEGAVAHALDGGLDGAKAGDDDDEGALGAGGDGFEEVGAFAVREADIDEEEVEGIAGEACLGLGEGSDGRDLVAAEAELLFEVLADDEVVFEDEDALEGHEGPDQAGRLGR
jgi:hypothetical protein